MFQQQSKIFRQRDEQEAAPLHVEGERRGAPLIDESDVSYGGVGSAASVKHRSSIMELADSFVEMTTKVSHHVRMVPIWTDFIHDFVRSPLLLVLTFAFMFAASISLMAAKLTSEDSTPCTLSFVVEPQLTGSYLFVGTTWSQFSVVVEGGRDRGNGATGCGIPVASVRRVAPFSASVQHFLGNFRSSNLDCTAPSLGSGEASDDGARTNAPSITIPGTCDLDVAQKIGTPTETDGLFLFDSFGVRNGGPGRHELVIALGGASTESAVLKVLFDLAPSVVSVQRKSPCIDRVAYRTPNFASAEVQFLFPSTSDPSPGSLSASIIPVQLPATNEVQQFMQGYYQAVKSGSDPAQVVVSTEGQTSILDTPYCERSAAPGQGESDNSSFSAASSSAGSESSGEEVVFLRLCTANVSFTFSVDSSRDDEVALAVLFGGQAQLITGARPTSTWWDENITTASHNVLLKAAEVEPASSPLELQVRWEENITVIEEGGILVAFVDVIGGPGSNPSDSHTVFARAYRVSYPLQTTIMEVKYLLNNISRTELAASGGDNAATAKFVLSFSSSGSPGSYEIIFSLGRTFSLAKEFLVRSRVAISHSSLPSPVLIPDHGVIHAVTPAVSLRITDALNRPIPGKHPVTICSSPVASLWTHWSSSDNSGMTYLLEAGLFFPQDKNMIVCDTFVDDINVSAITFKKFTNPIGSGSSKGLCNVDINMAGTVVEAIGLLVIPGFSNYILSGSQNDYFECCVGSPSYTICESAVLTNSFRQLPVARTFGSEVAVLTVTCVNQNHTRCAPTSASFAYASPFVFDGRNTAVTIENDTHDDRIQWMYVNASLGQAYRSKGFIGSVGIYLIPSNTSLTYLQFTGGNAWSCLCSFILGLFTCPAPPLELQHQGFCISYNGILSSVCYAGRAPPLTMVPPNFTLASIGGPQEVPVFIVVVEPTPYTQTLFFAVALPGVKAIDTPFPTSTCWTAAQRQHDLYDFVPSDCLVLGGEALQDGNSAPTITVEANESTRISVEDLSGNINGSWSFCVRTLLSWSWRCVPLAGLLSPIMNGPISFGEILLTSLPSSTRYGSNYPLNTFVDLDVVAWQNYFVVSVFCRMVGSGTSLQVPCAFQPGFVFPPFLLLGNESGVSIPGLTFSSALPPGNVEILLSTPIGPLPLGVIALTNEAACGLVLVNAPSGITVLAPFPVGVRFECNAVPVEGESIVVSITSVSLSCSGFACGVIEPVSSMAVTDEDGIATFFPVITDCAPQKPIYLKFSLLVDRTVEGDLARSQATGIPIPLEGTAPKFTDPITKQFKLAQSILLDFSVGSLSVGPLAVAPIVQGVTMDASRLVQQVGTQCLYSGSVTATLTIIKPDPRSSTSSTTVYMVLLNGENEVVNITSIVILGLGKTAVFTDVAYLLPVGDFSLRVSSQGAEAEPEHKLPCEAKEDDSQEKSESVALISYFALFIVLWVNTPHSPRWLFPVSICFCFALLLAVAVTFIDNQSWTSFSLSQHTFAVANGWALAVYAAGMCITIVQLWRLKRQAKENRGSANGTTPRRAATVTSSADNEASALRHYRYVYFMVHSRLRLPQQGSRGTARERPLHAAIMTDDFSNVKDEKGSVFSFLSDSAREVATTKLRHRRGLGRGSSSSSARRFNQDDDDLGGGDYLEVPNVAINDSAAAPKSVTTTSELGTIQQHPTGSSVRIREGSSSCATHQGFHDQNEEKRKRQQVLDLELARIEHHHTSWRRRKFHRVAHHLEHFAESHPGSYFGCAAANLAEMLLGEEEERIDLMYYSEKLVTGVPYELHPPVPRRFVIVASLMLGLIVLLGFGLATINGRIINFFSLIAAYISDGRDFDATNLQERFRAIMHSSIELTIVMFPQFKLGILRTLYPIEKSINIIGIMQSVSFVVQGINKYLPWILPLSEVIAFSVLIGTMFVMYEKLRELMIDARQGRLRARNIPAELEEADEYPGIHAVNLIVTFLFSAIYSFLFLTAAVLILTNLPKLLPGFFSVKPVVAISAIALIEKLGTFLVQLTAREGLEIQRPALYTIWSSMLVTLSFFGALFATVLRFLKYLTTGGLLFGRLDVQLVPTAVFIEDTAHKAFMSLVIVDHVSNNSYKLFFVSLLMTSQELKRLSAVQRFAMPSLMGFSTRLPTTQNLVRAAVSHWLGLVRMEPSSPTSPMRSILRDFAVPHADQEISSSTKFSLAQLCFAKEQRLCSQCAVRRERIVQRFFMWYLLTICPSIAVFRKHRLLNLHHRDHHEHETHHHEEAYVAKGEEHLEHHHGPSHGQIEKKSPEPHQMCNWRNHR